MQVVKQKCKINKTRSLIYYTYLPTLINTKVLYLPNKNNVELKTSKSIIILKSDLFLELFIIIILIIK